MPAVKPTAQMFAFGLVAACLSIGALPAVSGDWTSSYFVQAPAAPANRAVPDAPSAPSLLNFSTDLDYGSFTFGAGYARGPVHLHQGMTGHSDSEYLNLRAGIDFGQSLGYITLGRQMSPRHATTAQTAGLGLRVSLNRAIQLTGEFLHSIPSSDQTDGEDIHQSLSLRAAFRF